VLEEGEEGGGRWEENGRGKRKEERRGREGEWRREVRGGNKGGGSTGRDHGEGKEGRKG